MEDQSASTVDRALVVSFIYSFAELSLPRWPKNNFLTLFHLFSTILHHFYLYSLGFYPLSLSKVPMAPPKEKTKATKASHQQSTPPSIIIEEENLSTPLARRLYHEQCETCQVIDGRIIYNSSYVRRHFTSLITYDQEAFLISMRLSTKMM